MKEKNEINTSILKYIKKRDNTLQIFDKDKITQAIFKSMIAVNKEKYNIDDAINISKNVLSDLINNVKYNKVSKINKDKVLNDVSVIFLIEDVQDLVEENLMKSKYFDVAKAYILYREKRAEERKRDIFSKRTNLKPFEYPELYEYTKAIRHSYWVHTEFNFIKDIQDFKIIVNDTERSVIKNTMLAIAQIEVAVKGFWGDIYKKMPKPEIAAVGYTFAESEVRHMDAYSHLLEILGLNEEFKKIKNIPALIDRVQYLEKSIKNSKSDDNKEYTQSILLFSLFIEHVSLFSQFLIMMSFGKYKNTFKAISNVVEATSKEEQIHGMFGIEIIKIIQKEHKEWFDEKYINEVIDLCKESFEREKEVVDWIFEKGELDFLPKNLVLEFIKNRLNNSLIAIGIPKIFDINQDLVKKTNWFEEEIFSTKHVDFFQKKSINYNKRSQSFSSDDLF